MFSILSNAYTRSEREQKVEELMESIQLLKRQCTFRSVKSLNVPRITPSQWGALMCIEARGQSTVKEVADALGITSSATTQLIDGLVDNDYVLRETNKENRRTVLLVLSKKTKTHVARMKKKMMQRFLGLFDVLDPKEFDQYLQLNKKIVEQFSKK